mmetsp:Transcript_22505/g.57550  ORF Transcript_22505/g.57550 Transcript_22505/m.57550 type:complete len:293 (+) Transcript_22505:63-941(+)
MASSSVRALRAVGGRCLLERTNASPSAASCHGGARRGLVHAESTLVHAESTGSVVQVSTQKHWTAFMYGRERQLLVHVVNSVEEGDTDGVLQSMDDFWGHHFGMKGADSWSVRKGLLDNTMKSKRPERCLELGTYCGYSALRIAQSLPERGKLVSIEVDPLFGAIATKIIEYAGLRDKVKVLTGTVDTKLRRIQEVFARPGEDLDAVRLNFVLCDHSKDRFVPDLELLENAKLIGPGTIVMGDTTLYPGEDASGGGPNLLSHFAANDKFRIQQHIGTDKSSGITVCEWQHVV